MRRKVLACVGEELLVKARLALQWGYILVSLLTFSVKHQVFFILKKFLLLFSKLFSQPPGNGSEQSYHLEECWC